MSGISSQSVAQNNRPNSMITQAGQQSASVNGVSFQGNTILSNSSNRTNASGISSQSIAQINSPNLMLKQAGQQSASVTGISFWGALL